MRGVLVDVSAASTWEAGGRETVKGTSLEILVTPREMRWLSELPSGLEENPLSF